MPSKNDSEAKATLLDYDDNHGAGPPLVLLPGAGDVRSEYRGMADLLVAQGRRVVMADLPGHGGSPVAGSYGVAETAAALDALIGDLDAGPAVVVATSFAPAAVVWAAAERPGRIRALVAISPHMTADASWKGTLQRWVLAALMAGPWAGSVWARLYRSWYKEEVPADLDGELLAIRAMLSDPARRRAVRQTLTAHRRGMEEKLARTEIPTLLIFGTADDHFPDPAADAARLADTMGATVHLVEGAGHYPHVEKPEEAVGVIREFLDTVT